MEALREVKPSASGGSPIVTSIITGDTLMDNRHKLVQRSVLFAALMLIAGTCLAQDGSDPLFSRSPAERVPA